MPTQKIKEILESTNYVWIIITGIIIASIFIGSYIYTIDENVKDIKDLKIEKKQINDRLYKIEKDVSIIREKVSVINCNITDIKNSLRSQNEKSTITSSSIAFNRLQN